LEATAVAAFAAAAAAAAKAEAALEAVLVQLQLTGWQLEHHYEGRGAEKLLSQHAYLMVVTKLGCCHLCQ
jgi:hypothetical protein